MTWGNSWFFGIDAFAGVLFFLISSLVALTSYRAYKFFGKREYRLLSVGFLLIGVSYLLLGAANLFAYLMGNGTLNATRAVIISTNVGWFFHSLLFLTGLLILIALYYKIKGSAVQILLFLLTIFAFLLSGHLSSAFYILSAILLLFLLVKQLHNYRSNRKRAALFVFIGFLLLFTGEIVLSVLFIEPAFYAAGRILAAAGFVSILVSQLQVMQ